MTRVHSQAAASPNTADIDDEERRRQFVEKVGRDARSTKRGGLFLYYFFMVCRVLSLSGSAAVPVLVLFSQEKVATAIIGFAVFLSETLIRVIDPGAHSINHIRKSDALSYLLASYQVGIPPFDDVQTSFKDFARRVIAVRKTNLDSELLVLGKTFDVERESTGGRESRPS